MLLSCFLCCWYFYRCHRCAFNMGNTSFPHLFHLIISSFVSFFLHWPAQTTSFQSYKQVIVALIFEIKKLYQGKAIWKSTTAIHGQTADIMGAFRRFTTNHVRIRLASHTSNLLLEVPVHTNRLNYPTSSTASSLTRCMTEAVSGELQGGARWSALRDRWKDGIRPLREIYLDVA